MMIQFKNIFILACVVCMLSSCVKEFIDPVVQPADMLTIQLSLPDVSKAGETRASTAEQESVIRDAMILFYSVTDKKLVKILTTSDQNVTLTTTSIKFRSRLLDCTIPYDVVVLANLPSSTVIDLPALDSSFDDLNKTYATLTGRLSITDAGLVMSGLISNQNFRTTPVTTVDLRRQAVKFRVKLKFSEVFLAAYPDVTINTPDLVAEMNLRCYNLPNASFIYGTPDATRFNTLAAAYNMKLKDYDYQGFTADVVNAVYTKEVYGYENVVSGQTAVQSKAATNFILCLPYFILNADKTTTKVVDNYYKINIDNPTQGDARYATHRNYLYDISVTVHGFGDKVPAIDGLDVVTKVLPWNGVETPVETPANNLLELSNTECHIYGEKDDDLLVATATLKRPLYGSKLTITEQGEGFDLIGNTTYTLEPYKPHEIRVKVTDLFKTGSLMLAYGGYTQTIKISTNFDNQQILFDGYSKALSNVSWCTLSPQAEYVHGQQKWTQLYDKDAPIYLNISKATLRETKRIGTVMLTKADKTVTRVVLVQQPYIKHTGETIEWATGNISIGHRPDGELCYVIGGAFDYGLWFRFMRSYGHVYEAAVGSSWSETNSHYYVPSGDGISAKVTLGNITNYANIYSADYGFPAGQYPSSQPEDIDPCSFVYTGDLSVKWRTPTKDELTSLLTGAQWYNNGSVRGITCSNGLFLRCAGGRNGGISNSKIRGTESAGTGAMALYWSSTRGDQSSTDFNGDRGYGIKPRYGSSIVVENVVMNTVNSVRCVRDISK